MLDLPRVSFTSREERSRVTTVPLTATQRFQRKLRLLLAERKHTTGDNAPIGALASYVRPQVENQSWLSNILSARGTQPNLNDIEGFASFFHVSVSEVLGYPANPKELSGDEQRLVLAFRALPEPTRDHFLAILEAASLNVQMSDRHGQKRTGKSITTRVGDRLRGVDSIRPLEDPSATLRALQDYLRTLTLELGAIAAGVVPHRDDQPSHAEKPAGH